MHRIFRIPAFIIVLFILTAGLCQAQSSGGSPVSVSVYDRTRVDSWEWFAAPPNSNTYGYVESLLSIGAAQRLRRWDWRLELAQPSVLDAPSDAVSSVTAQGQLGLGGTYYASNTNSYPAAAFLKQGFVRYDGEAVHLRVGRFEFFDGREMQTNNPTIGWLQTNRISDRLIGNFGFSTAQRSFDGLDAHYGSGAGTSPRWRLAPIRASST